MWHLEFPEMKAEVVVVALLRLPRIVPNFSCIFGTLRPASYELN